MSANNQIVIVDEKDGTFSVWYDGCVDNPFPTSAIPKRTNCSVDEAMRVARELGYTEYGIIFVDGPIADLKVDAKAEIHRQQNWTNESNDELRVYILQTATTLDWITTNCKDAIIREQLTVLGEQLRNKAEEL